MSFSGESHHRCLCFGEEDGRGGTYLPCPPELCEADALLDRAESVEAEVRRLTEGLRERDALLRQMLEHMEFAHYPQTNDGPHLADPFDLMDKARALLSASPSDGDCEHDWIREHGTSASYCARCGVGPVATGANTEGGEA